MSATLTMVPLAKIKTRQGFNPRSGFADEQMAELVASVKRHGIITPLTLAPDGDGFVIFRRRPQQRHPADVDLLDGLGQGDASLGHRLLKGIEIDDDQINGDKLMRLQFGLMGRRPPGQDAAVDGGMERFDPAIQNFGKACQGFDGDYGQTSSGQLACRAAAGNQLHTSRMQTVGEV